MAGIFGNKELFEKNVNAFFKVDEPYSKAMSKLESMGLDAPLHFVKTDDGNLFDGFHKEYMYKDVAGDFAEKKAYFDENFPKHPVIFLYGFGNGKLVDYLLKNPKHKRVIVFENELAPLFYALHEFEWAKDLRKERLIPFYVPKLNPAQLEVLFRMKDINTALKTYNFTSECKFYETHYKETIEQINQKLIESVRFAFLVKGNDPKDSLIGIEHTLKHLPKMLARPSLKELLKARKHNAKTAIVVSTGPSLTKQLPLLKEYADKAIIICADSAYVFLHKQGIKPDYVLSLERVPETAELFNNDFGEFDKGIDFVLVSLTHPKTIEYIEKNNRKYMLVLRPLLFPTYLKLPDFGYLGTYHSVSNMCFELAVYLGCENIILIGQDLAYSTEGESHPDGYIFKEKKVTNETPNILKTTAYGGVGEVKTNIWWLIFKEGFEKDISIAHIRFQTTTYNCTEGGARIEGAVEMPFKQVCETLLTQKLKKPFKALPSPSKKEAKSLLNATKKHLEDLLKKSESFLAEVKKELLYLGEILPPNYDFDTLNFKALAQSYKRLLKFRAKFEKSVLFTEIANVSSFHNDCEMVRLECVVCHNKKEENELLVSLVSTMANWFAEVGNYLYTQGELIKRYIKEW